MDSLESMFDAVNVDELKGMLMEFAIGGAIAYGGMLAWKYIDSKLATNTTYAEYFGEGKTLAMVKPVLPMIAGIGAAFAVNRFAPQYAGYARGAAVGMTVLAIANIVSTYTKDAPADSFASKLKSLNPIAGMDYGFGRDPFARYLNAAPITVEENVNGAPITVEESVGGMNVAATFA